MPTKPFLRAFSQISLTQDSNKIRPRSLKKLIKMKKPLSITAILWCILWIHSCREPEGEAISDPSIETSVINQRTHRDQSQNTDSLKAASINDPDPPIKDGQDWRMGYGRTVLK